MPFLKPEADKDPGKQAAAHAQNARVMERTINGLPIFDRVLVDNDALATYSNATTSYTNFGGTTGSIGNVSGLFNKFNNFTKVQVDVSGTFFTVNTGKAQLGVTFVDQLSSASYTYDVTFHFFNTAVLGTHIPFVGKEEITDLPAGQYRVTLVGKAAAGQTIQTNVDDHAEMTIEERPVYA